MSGAPRLSIDEWRSRLREIDRESVARLADLSGADPALAVAAHEKFGCPIDLVAIGRSGDIGPEHAPPLEAARAIITGAGVPKTAVRIVTREQDLERYDLIAALESFSCRHRVRPIGRFLRRHGHETSRLLIDIRKGSGGFPFLKRFGNPVPFETWKDGERPVHRTLVIFEPKAPAGSAGAWAALAERLIGESGFHRQNERHAFTFIPRSADTLVVTFDNLDIAMEKRADRRPWGYAFIERQGWSMLGVMAAGWTWYRDPWVSDEFDRLAAEGFFDRFARVVFYGASMGGYGALAFAPAAGGRADVVAMSPQTVLDKEKVPWETRYRVAWEADWSGRYADAAETVRAARRVNLFYDPYSPLDAAHVARLEGDNIVRYRCPFLGHRLGSALQQMGILQPLVKAAIEGRLDLPTFRRTLRARRNFRRYRREILDLAIDRGHVRLARRLARRFLAEGDDRHFRAVLARLETAEEDAP